MSAIAWYEGFAELDEPATDVLAEMQARTEALMARLYAEDDALIEIDPQACDDWLAQAAAEYDVTQEV